MSTSSSRGGAPPLPAQGGRQEQPQPPPLPPLPPPLPPLPPPLPPLPPLLPYQPQEQQPPQHQQANNIPLPDNQDEPGDFVTVPCRRRLSPGPSGTGGPQAAISPTSSPATKTPPTPWKRTEEEFNNNTVVPICPGPRGTRAGGGTGTTMRGRLEEQPPCKACKRLCYINVSARGISIQGRWGAIEIRAEWRCPVGGLKEKGLKVRARKRLR